VIDLHLHTTASDGQSTPAGLVRAAAAAGIETMAVTDHDTMAAVAAVQDEARAAGIEAIAGVEVTAVHDGRDVHVLGYFVDAADAAFNEFLLAQRLDRRRRVFEIAARLERMGAPIDSTTFEAEAGVTGRALGRPRVAAALVAAGHAKDIGDAFERFLGEGRPAFVERRGAAPAEVVERIAAAGGVAALAHPGKLDRDDLIGSMIDAGMAAIEVYHPDHDDATTVRYGDLARSRGLLVTGGSDYHGPDSARAWAFGRISVPPGDWSALRARGQPR
jgi:predicted metal-dependent phosphoesterase TrpH